MIFGPILELFRERPSVMGNATLAAFLVIVLLAASGGRSTDRDAVVAETSIVATAANASESKPAPAPSGSTQFSGEQRSEIENIVRSYLLENPELLRDMTEALQAKETAERDKRNVQLVMDNKESLYKSEHDYVYGNKKGDIGVVEYFDYNCAWCKRALTEVQKLADQDPNVRVVMKEFPIFGADSEFAAKAAMAAVRQDKYWDLHVALMQQKRVTKDSVLQSAKELGLDIDRLQKDMQDPEIGKALRETAEIATKLDIQGTPAFIIDTSVNVGFVPVDGLKSMIADARSKGCQASC